MLDAKELRLNNLVMCKVSNDAGIYRVTAIGGWKRIVDKKDKDKWHDERMIYIDRCTTKPNGEPYVESKIKGIKLTEEWLIKCGFTKDSHGEFFIKTIQDTYLVFVHPNNSDFFYPRLQFVPDHIIEIPLTEINYVHSLQNLYFSLTGKELELLTK